MPISENVTTRSLRSMKRKAEKICMLTAYDYQTARLLDALGIDCILVGDSAAMVFAGHETTLPITMDEMLYHVKAVNRARKRALLIADMPFLSYQVSAENTIRNAGRMLKEGGANAIKIEGGKDLAPLVKQLTGMGIPVMGHIGMTPQSVNQLGGFKLQGKDETAAARIAEAALSLEKAGCFALVLEKIPEKLAKSISESLTIPTIGIGAGPHCDGQVLVVNDMLGQTENFSPRFLKRYANLADTMKSAFTAYIEEVKSGEFPSTEHSY